MNKRARKPFSRFIFLSLLSCLATLCGSAHAQEQAIGRAITVAGDVDLVSLAGERRALARGSEIHAGDLIITGPAARAQVRLVDGALISFLPGTEFEFSDFAYDGKGGAGDSAIMSLIRGGFRTMSGTIGEGQGDVYRVVTEFANIGIRGTTHRAVIDPASNTLYTGVADGGTTVSNPLGALDLGIGADYDFSETRPGQAPRGLLELPLAVASYDLVALAAAQAPAAGDLGNTAGGGNQAGGEAAALAAAPSGEDAPEAGTAQADPGVAARTAESDEDDPGQVALAAAPAEPRNQAQDRAPSTPAPTPAEDGSPQVSRPALASETQIEAPALAAAAAIPPPETAGGKGPAAQAPTSGALAKTAGAEPAAPAAGSTDRTQGNGLLGALAGTLGEIRSEEGRGNNGRDRGEALASALTDILGDAGRERGKDSPKDAGNGKSSSDLARLLDSIGKALGASGRDSPSSPGAARPDSLTDARARNRPAPVVAENTGDDTEAAINPAQNPGRLLAEVLGRIIDGKDDDDKGKGRDKDERGDDEERGNGRGLASRGGDDDEGEDRGRGRNGNSRGDDDDEERGDRGRPSRRGGDDGNLFSRRVLAQTVETEPAEMTLVGAPPGGLGAGVILMHEAPSPGASSLRPKPGFDVSWGFWNGEQPVITHYNASGTLTPLPELAYWARVLPADMAELRKLSANWRFATAPGEGHFLGAGSAGALTGLDMSFDVDLASGLISGGRFQAVAGAQSWSLGFSGQVEGPRAMMHSFTNTAVQGPDGTGTRITGNIGGVFTGTGNQAGFVTGFSLGDGAQSHVQGLGLLEGAPR